MAFTEFEIAEHAAVIERVFWSRRRPPLHIRDRIREGQHIEGQSVELFFVRPVWDDPTRHTEESIAKLTFVLASGVWRIFWKRADLKWHRYPARAGSADARSGVARRRSRRERVLLWVSRG